MTVTRTLALAIALLASPSVAIAANPAPPAAASTERRLAPEEIDKILNEAARKREAGGFLAEAPEPTTESPGAPIHGEVGLSIGTGGYRAAHGTAVMGLPGDGVAIISLGTRRLPDGSHFYPAW